ncbi:ABC transporter permease subunit [Halosimplex salinum]|uniref:ABC transporter permease subunit n=1 Tax=Halosimplex salinum TaxID=1710538 RepID=UPI000F49F0DA|nr:ABC transporter permease subunit [Halosimplex salinum]
MTWRSIARQDSALTVSARSVKYLLSLLVLGILLLGYIYPVVGAEPYTTSRFPGFAQGLLTTLVPFVGVLLGYNAVVSDRESGAIRLTLSLPQSRSDVVLGTFVSRTGVLAGTLVAALVVYPFGELELGRFLLFVGLTVAFAAVWSGLGIAVSLAVATKRRALVLGFALLFLFVLVWDTLENALTAGLSAAGLADDGLPAAAEFLFALAPGRVFERATAGFVDPSRSLGEAWYLGEWVALVLLALWIVGPIGLAYARFAGRDLS